MYFQYRLYSIIVTFINKIFLIRLWLINDISHQHLYFEVTNLHNLKAVLMSPAWFPSGILPWSTCGVQCIPGVAGAWSLLWEVAHSESLSAAARPIQSKHFLPFFLTFLIYKTEIAIQLPFGKHFEVYGQSTLVLIAADVCQPSCPLEIITLHSLGSRGGQVHGLLLLLISAVCQPLLQEHRQSEISQSVTWELSQPSVLVTLCLYTVASIEFPVQGVTDDLQQVQSRLVWAGVEGLRHLGWLGWTRAGLGRRVLRSQPIPIGRFSRK